MTDLRQFTLLYRDKFVRLSPVGRKHWEPFLWIYQLDSGDMEPMICAIEARRMAVCGETLPG